MADRIKKARLRTGLSQDDFGRAVGVKQKQVWRWEKGENAPRFDQLQEIARVADVTLEWLQTGREHPSGDLTRSAYPSLTVFISHRSDLTEQDRRALLSLDTGGDIGSDDFWSALLTVIRGQLAGARGAVRIDQQVDTARATLKAMSRKGNTPSNDQKAPPKG